MYIMSVSVKTGKDKSVFQKEIALSFVPPVHMTLYLHVFHYSVSCRVEFAAWHEKENNFTIHAKAAKCSQEFFEKDKSWHLLVG